MSYRLLLDENVARSVGARLDALGHDVERVESVPSLGAGTHDEDIVAYLSDADRILLTYDDDFRTVTQGTPVFFVADETLGADTVAAIVDAIAGHYPQSAVDGVTYASTEWL